MAETYGDCSPWHIDKWHKRTGRQVSYINALSRTLISAMADQDLEAGSTCTTVTKRVYTVELLDRRKFVGRNIVSLSLGSLQFRLSPPYVLFDQVVLHEKTAYRKLTHNSLVSQTRFTLPREKS
jgi:hypothetical protein